MKKAEREDAIVHGLRVLTKTQWRRLRNRYLNEQRQNMAAAKALLRKTRPSQPPEASNSLKTYRKNVDRAAAGDSGTHQPTADSVAENGSSGSALPAADIIKSGSRSQQAFTPGVIVKVCIESGKLHCYLGMIQIFVLIDANVCTVP